MNPELQNILAMLALKLGTSVEHLFPILVSHARTEAITSIIFGMVGMIPVILCLRWALKILKGDGSLNCSDLFPFACMTAIVGGVAAIILPIMVACSVPDVLYPEATAIQSLFHK
jgi:hypothetical protein